MCPPGTEFDETSKSCIDENECDTNPDEVCPNGKCINTKGSYTCQCEEGKTVKSTLKLQQLWIVLSLGSILDPSGRFCVDSRKGSCWTHINNQDQCENNLATLTLKSECCCSSFGVAWGSPCQVCDPSVDCECDVGFAKVDGKVCSDLNECKLYPGICQGGICINTEGGFTCQCPQGIQTALLIIGIFNDTFNFRTFFGFNWKTLCWWEVWAVLFRLSSWHLLSCSWRSLQTRSMLLLNWRRLGSPVHPMPKTWDQSISRTLL